LAQDWGIGDFEMATLVNAGVLALVEEAVAAGVAPDAARKWWAGEFTRIANESGVEPTSLTVTPADIARVEELIATGALNDKLARQVFEGVIAGEGSPDEVVAARGLAVVSDDGALLAAIDDALAAQPDVAEKIRGGKVQAAGAIVGAVMKATRGQADAGKVRELLLERLGVSES
jgi:aspartyl-tRNA(Asn)/glutamyl-tRNA(Gln) amidotransferase subunit B